jgi:hypothetical protein
MERTLAGGEGADGARRSALGPQRFTQFPGEFPSSNRRRDPTTMPPVQEPLFWTAVHSPHRPLGPHRHMSTGSRSTVQRWIPAIVGLGILAGHELWIEILGRHVPAINTPDGIRAVNKAKPVDPGGVELYLEGKFGEALPAVREAQNNGERPGCAKPVTFRKPQMKIIEAYRDRGGLSQFLVDEAGGRLPEKRCVWSDKVLLATYAVDHVIPFSLWHCNDLWNLLPCDSGVNGNKSDRLPERSLMFKRKDAIVFYWEKAQQRHKRRFEHELAKFTATPIVAGNWQNAAFQRLVEAVEITAIQRGAERWQP